MSSLENLLTNSHTWLITGVAGFIGSNLMEYLLKCDQKVIGLDNFSTGKQANIESVLSVLSSSQKRNFIFYKGDTRNLIDCEKALSHVDFVLHQAALGSVPRSIENPLLVNEVNATGFLNILVSSKNAKVKRVVYASSSSVYGDSPILPKVEDQIGQPLSPYAVTKYTNELYAKTFSRCYGLEIIGLRYFNVFGPRQDAESGYAAVIPRWIYALLEGHEVFINGDGETSRDFCYVENVIQANIRAALTQNNAALNQVYNIAVGDQTTLNTVFNIIAAEIDSSFCPQPFYRNFREGDIRHSLANISKARELLEYQPTHRVKEGLQNVVKWYKKQRR